MAFANLAFLGPDATIRERMRDGVCVALQQLKLSNKSIYSTCYRYIIDTNFETPTVVARTLGTPTGIIQLLLPFAQHQARTTDIREHYCTLASVSTGR